jgi:hypothetical protein
VIAASSRQPSGVSRQIPMKRREHLLTFAMVLKADP